MKPNKTPQQIALIATVNVRKPNQHNQELRYVEIPENVITTVAEGGLNIMQSRIDFYFLPTPVSEKHWETYKETRLQYFIKTLNSIRDVNKTKSLDIKLATGVVEDYNNWDENLELSITNNAHWINKWEKLVEYLSSHYPSEIAFWDLCDEPPTATFPLFCGAKRIIKNAENLAALSIIAENDSSDLEGDNNENKFSHPVICNLFPYTNSEQLEGNFIAEVVDNELRSIAVNDIIKNLIEGKSLLSLSILNSDDFLELQKPFNDTELPYINYLATYQFIFNPEIWCYDQYPFNVNLSNNEGNSKNNIIFDRKNFFRMLLLMNRMSEIFNRPFYAYSLCVKYVYCEVTTVERPISESPGQKMVNIYKKLYERPYPSLGILRIQAFCPLVFGAKGIVYWRYTNNDYTKIDYNETMQEGDVIQKVETATIFQDAPLIKVSDFTDDNTKYVDQFRITDIYDNIKIVNEKIKNFEGLFCNAKIIDAVGTSETATGGQLKTLDYPWGTVRGLEYESDLLLSYIKVEKTNSDTVNDGELYDYFLVVINLDFENINKCRIDFATGARELLKFNAKMEQETTELSMKTTIKEDYENKISFDGEFEPGDMRIFKVRL